jgi:hypothetical protein
MHKFKIDIYDLINIKKCITIRINNLEGVKEKRRYRESLIKLLEKLQC